MKTLTFALGIASISLATAVGYAQAAPSEPSVQQMQDCFTRHSQLMEKPAVRNLYDCWYTHGYLMKDPKQS